MNNMSELNKLKSLFLVSSSLLLAACGSGSVTESQSSTPSVPSNQTSCSALNSLAIVTATDDGTHDSYGPLNTIDADYSNQSRWSSEGIGKTITFDLGQISTVRDMQIQWYQGNLLNYSFKVDTSNNNVDWTSVLSAGNSNGEAAELETVELTDSQARYLRITGLGNTSSEWNSIIEAKVRGCGTLATNQDSVVNTPTESNIDFSLWDNEGGDPKAGEVLIFNALTAQYVSPNGSGWRHELKIKKSLRVAMTAVYEEFYADIKVNLSLGSKLIVAQHHGGNTGTIVKVYIADSNESGFFDSTANNGIFDLYVRLAKKDGSGEVKKALGTLQSGDNFELRIVNNFGYVTVSAFDQSISLNVADSAGAYFKFGNYLQAQDAATATNVEDSDDWAQFYQDAAITLSEVTFSRLNYTREYP
tara:strand:- start:5722 stop:6972 length:1251 start_codon:yes stop_codon:yes gene_type:complete